MCIIVSESKNTGPPVISPFFLLFGPWIFCLCCYGENKQTEHLLASLCVLYFLNTKKLNASRVAGTMVARSPSVRAVAHSNLSQVPPLHMHVGK